MGLDERSSALLAEEMLLLHRWQDYRKIVMFLKKEWEIFSLSHGHIRLEENKLPSKGYAMR